MTRDEQFGRLLEEHQNLLRQFVATELDLALTFCERALSAQHPDGNGRTSVPNDAIARNTDNAKKAYSSAMRAMQRSERNIEKDADIAERMDRLRPLFAQL